VLQSPHVLDADHHFSVLTDLLEATIVVSFPSGAASHVCGPTLTENEASKASVRLLQ
jgi:hypothetical protein